MADEQPTKRMRFTGQTVSIQVGAEDVPPFTVHKVLITEDSGFLKAVIDIKCEDGQDHMVYLINGNVNIFATYIEWLYEKTITSSFHDDLTMMYVLGEKLQSSGFCNAIIATMLEIINKNGMIAIEHVNIIYAGTSRDSPARRFVVDVWKLNVWWSGSRMTRVLQIS